MTEPAWMSPGQMLIDGAWVDALDGGRRDVIDPALAKYPLLQP